MNWATRDRQTSEVLLGILAITAAVILLLFTVYTVFRSLDELVCGPTTTELCEPGASGADCRHQE